MVVHGCAAEPSVLLRQLTRVVEVVRQSSHTKRASIFLQGCLSHEKKRPPRTLQ